MSCRSRIGLSAWACVLSLTAGCDNAVEHLAVEEWREAGTASTPFAGAEIRYSVTTLAPGGEREVLPGDLVQLRVARSGDSPRDISVWTGTHAAPELAGVLGADGLRAALVGRKLGERFALAYDGSAPEAAWLPVNVFMTMPELLGLSWTLPADGGRVSAREWPRLDLAGAQEWQIEVLGVCAARLLHRAATLRQWGYVLELSLGSRAARREGTLHWLAVEAVCADGEQRIQAGPLYDERESLRAQRLHRWQASYLRLRSPARFPAEWELTPPR